MDTFECIRTRRSIREYSDKVIPKEVYVNIIDSARYAPSAGNLQPWKFVVIDDDHAKKEIASSCSGQYWMEQAQIHVIVCCVVDKPSMHYGPRGEMLYSIQDCAMAVENMLLAAHEFGIGGCFVGAFVEEDVRHIAHIPENVRIQGIVTLGYAADVPEMPDKVGIESVIYFDTYGNNKKDLSLFLWDISDYTQKLIEKAQHKIHKAAHPQIEKLKHHVKAFFGKEDEHGTHGHKSHPRHKDDKKHH